LAKELQDALNCFVVVHLLDTRRVCAIPSRSGNLQRRRLTRRSRTCYRSTSIPGGQL
jgi:hypothetical protein